MEQHRQFLVVEDGSGKRVAYRVDGAEVSVAKVVFFLAPSLGDVKEEYRHLAPILCDGGKNSVVSVDLRGMGESDVGFSSYEVDDTGRDLGMGETTKVKETQVLAL